MQHDQGTPNQKVDTENFETAYHKWKQAMRELRIRLRSELTEEELAEVIENAQDIHRTVLKQYESLKADGIIPDQITRQKADGCTANTNNLISLAQTRMSEFGIEPWNDANEKARLRVILDTDYARSVYGSVSARSTSSRLSARSNPQSCSSDPSTSITSKRAEVAVQLAAKTAELQALQDEETQRSQLERELRRLDVEKQIKITKAMLSTYDKELQATNQIQDAVNNVKQENSQPLNANAAVFVPQTQTADLKETLCHSFAALGQTLQQTLDCSSMPVREPSAFSGDPLHFIKWKRTFEGLVGQKNIRDSDKLAFLERYVTGEAAECIEGMFYRTDDKAYKDAMTLLNERFGHPSVVLNAFKSKLSAWPKIGAREYTALRKLSDFLTAIDYAMPHVPGLQNLNDEEENKKLLRKLPDWIITKWGNVVADQDKKRLSYPSFHQFVDFLATQARIATRPVCSLQALYGGEGSTSKRNVRPNQSHQVRATNVFATSSEQPSTDGDTAKSKNCVFCKASDHYLPSCMQFMKRSLEERKNFVKEAKRCYKCLRLGHTSKACKSPHSCRKCKGKHPLCLHDDDFKGIAKNTTAKVLLVNNNVESCQAHATSFRVNNTKALPATSLTLPVWLSSKDNPDNETLVYALVDSQSDTTFVDQTLAEQLNLSPRFKETTRLNVKTLSTTDGSSTSIVCDKITNLRVRGYMDNTYVDLPASYTVNHIPFQQETVPTCETAKHWRHLQHIADQIPPLLNCEPGILIGFDCSHAFLPRECIAGDDTEPFAVKTDLGWGIIGSATHSVPAKSICNRITTKEVPLVSPSDAVKALERDFENDKHADKAISQDDLQFLHILENGIIREEDGRCKMPLPFKFKQVPTLPNNRCTAVKRLDHLKQKFIKNKDLQSEYTLFMEDILKNGDAEEVSLSPGNGQEWYIPHHGVFHPRKGKLRVVFDCSAKFQNTCLNDHLLPGPNLINSLVGTLCRFRQHPVAVTCDVERMFHQFRVSEDHRDFLRFLWWKNGDLTKEPSTFRMKVHLFGATSSPGCANYGLKYLARQNEDRFPTGAKFIQEDFYVDDGCSSKETDKEAIKLVQEATAVCKEGGLRLHKFMSNSRTVLDQIPPSERASNMQTLDLSFEELPAERTLGMQWSIQSDSIRFSFSPAEKPATRRGVLSTVASLYDPLGLLAPFVLAGKRILQEACLKGTKWDDLIPKDLQTEWENWKKDCTILKRLSIPRCYFPIPLSCIKTVQLHHFSDASFGGYGMCTYLRALTMDNQVHCSLVVAKSRVAPTKVTSIPRLELTAALVSAEIGHTIKEELTLPIDEEFYWTDSKVVLGYINNDARKFHIFVANRVQKIRDLTNPSQWFYITTESNPADMASRGLTAAEIQRSTWLSGPAFLLESQLKSSQEPTPQLQTGDPEVRVISLRTQVSCLFDLDARLSHFSRWRRVVIVMAKILQLASKASTSKPSLTAVQAAEIAVIKGVQNQLFATEMEHLARGTPIPSSSELKCAEPFLQDGILRVGGRLEKGSFSLHEKHPIILPKNCNLTRLLICHCHELVRHQGRGMTLNEIRSQGYWILGGARQVDKFIKNCIICRKLRGACQEQKMAGLPRERLDASPPFTHVGMDVFGPFHVKNGRRETKRYGLLFTCFCSRAIHIELLDDLSTDSFINALRCFIAIRGAVQSIQSDQGTNFIGAANELKSAVGEMDPDRIETFLMEKQCQFKFNTPNASHTGGVWERQIRTVRSVLNATLALCPGRLDDASLRTLFYETMAIVNARPLTSMNQGDPTSAEPLTPNHILTMKSKVPLPPPGKFTKEDMFLRKRWRRVQYLMEQFWSRWRREYVSSLAQRQKWLNPRRNLTVGDVVLIADQEAPRSRWQLGQVTAAPKDDDGLVRHVQLRLATAALDARGRRLQQPLFLERPIQKLVLIMEAQ